MIYATNTKSTHIANKQITLENKITSRRAVAPVIATILLVAMAVVGGGVVFAISDDSHSHLEISNSYQSTFIEITGHDLSDVSVLTLHDGAKVNNSINAGDFDGQTGNGLLTGERIAVYVQNNSVSPVFFDEVRLGGMVYAFVPVSTLTAHSTTFMNPGEFVIATEGTTGVANLSSSAELKAGQEATFLIELEHNIPMTRDTQFKITTTNGEVFVGTVYVGLYHV